ncbi:MAG: YabP/YqfC family sporulation protein [Erysipelotrichaceae bacterium]|nr:YabP/YqfC family sporulation protein [Erysipelotrichaceae bacterium]
MIEVISLDEKQVMIEHYQGIQNVTSCEIRVQMKTCVLVVKGQHLHVAAMSKYEIWIQGKLEGVLFEYEKEEKTRTR